MELAERAPPRAAADAAGARGAARLCQARALRRPARFRGAGRSLSRRASSAAISRKADREQFPDALEKHRLRREIIATQLANSHDQPRRAVAGGAHRRPDRRGAGRHRRGLRRGARQLRHAGAQRRDRRARRQDPRQACSSRSMPPCRTCCSTGWSGSCAMSICRRAWRASSSITATASPRWLTALDAALPKEAAAARAARSEGADRRGRAGRARRRASPASAELAAAPDIVLVADRTGKPIDVIAATYLRRARRTSGSTASSTAARGIVGVRLFRPAGARPRARHDRRRRAPAHRGDGRDRQVRRSRGRSLGRAAQGARSSASAASIHEIANSGLTLSKLTVAASLLGDLAKG